MKGRGDTQWFGKLKRRRRATALVLLLTVFVLVAVATRRGWRREYGQDPNRLGLLYEAWTEFNARRYDAATATLDRRASEVAPTALDWMLRARIAEQEGRLEDALDQLKHIPDSDRIGAQARLKAGQIELARHRARAAEAAYLRSIALDPDQVQPYRDLAYLYAVQRRKAECDAQFRALVRLMPLDCTMAFAWCQNYCGLWDVDGAQKALLQFIAVDPDDQASRLALATSYVLTGRLDEAEAALRLLPNSDPDARALRVQIVVDRGDTEAAETLLRDGPADHARLNFFSGRLAMQHNDPRRAADHFRAALRQDPEDRDAIQGLGVALRSLGDPRFKEYLQTAFRNDQLKRIIKDSVTTIETDLRIFYKLGEICESLNRIDEARAWYRLAITRDPLDAQAQQGLTRLDQPARSQDPTPIPKPGRGDRSY